MAKFTSYPHKRVLLGNGKRAIFNSAGEFETEDKAVIEKLEKAKDVQAVKAPRKKPSED